MKNCFLIGDSIRQGYCGFAKENLADIANVYYPADNCRYTQYTLVQLCDEWVSLAECGAENVDIVHWNNGHWDIRHWDGDGKSLNTVEQYCDMLERIYLLLKKLFPNAEIIFATTTPMNPGSDVSLLTRTTDEIKVYNAAAKKTITRLGGTVNDLFDFMKDASPDMYIDHCHYTDEAFKLLGQRVAEVLKERLI